MFNEARKTIFSYCTENKFSKKKIDLIRKWLSICFKTYYENPDIAVNSGQVYLGGRPRKFIEITVGGISKICVYQ